MPKLNVLVAGSTGYIGVQLIKLLVKHSKINIKYICGNTSVGKKISYYDQDDNYATYANKISSENRKINFNKSVNEVLNLIRAHAPKPGAWLTIQNERIKIIKARKSNSNGNPSTIINDSFDIGCNDGSIEPLILQREGKNAISKDDFLRGYSFKINDIINT